MAKHTLAITLTADWQAVSTGDNTVLIQISPVASGRVALAVVDALVDADDTPAQHYLSQFDNPIANFFNLTGKLIAAKKLVAAESPILIVTEY